MSNNVIYEPIKICIAKLSRVPIAAGLDKKKLVNGVVLRLEGFF